MACDGGGRTPPGLIHNDMSCYTFNDLVLTTRLRDVWTGLRSRSPIEAYRSSGADQSETYCHADCKTNHEVIDR